MNSDQRSHNTEESKSRSVNEEAKIGGVKSDDTKSKNTARKSATSEKVVRSEARF